MSTETHSLTSKVGLQLFTLACSGRFSAPVLVSIGCHYSGSSFWNKSPSLYCPCNKGPSSQNKMYVGVLSHHLPAEYQAFCLILLHTPQRTRYPEHKYTSFPRNLRTGILPSQITWSQCSSRRQIFTEWTSCAKPLPGSLS